MVFGSTTLLLNWGVCNVLKTGFEIDLVESSGIGSTSLTDSTAGSTRFSIFYFFDRVNRFDHRVNPGFH